LVTYLAWFYFPPHDAPPTWVRDFVDVVTAARTQVESRSVQGLTSDRVLGILAPGLTALGYQVVPTMAKRHLLPRQRRSGCRRMYKIGQSVSPSKVALAVAAWRQSRLCAGVIVALSTDRPHSDCDIRARLRW
jgi:hypothetical protein